MAAATISVDEFQALEQKVLQTVGLIRKEREARAAAEAERDAAQAEIAAAQAAAAAAQQQAAEVQDELAELRNQLLAAGDAQGQVEALERERESTRQRVEKMLSTLDELL